MIQLLITFGLVAFFAISLSLKLLTQGKAAHVGCGSGDSSGSCSCSSVSNENTKNCGSCTSEPEVEKSSCSL